MSGATHVHERRDDELAGLWETFKSTGDQRAREGLILHFSPLVKFVAGRLGSGLPRNVDPSDLVSYGTFGLIDAIDKFEPERGYKFETYAVNRIKGAILDELHRARLGSPICSSESPRDSALDGRTRTQSPAHSH